MHTFFQHATYTPTQPFHLPDSPPRQTVFLIYDSQLITNHCERHELKDAPTASLLQALHTLLYEALHKLSVRTRHLRAHDG